MMTIETDDPGIEAAYYKLLALKFERVLRIASRRLGEHVAFDSMDPVFPFEEVIAEIKCSIDEVLTNGLTPEEIADLSLWSSVESDMTSNHDFKKL